MARLRSLSQLAAILLFAIIVYGSLAFCILRYLRAISYSIDLSSAAAAIGLLEKPRLYSPHEIFDIPNDQYWQIRMRETKAIADEWRKTRSIPGYREDFYRIMISGSDSTLDEHEHR